MAIYVEFGKPIGHSCEALSCSFDQTAPSRAGGLQQRAQRHGITFTKEVDYLSAKIWSHAATGTIFDKVIIEFYKKAEYTPFITYTAINAIISHVSSSFDREQINLNIEDIRVNTLD
jgi:type VI protein secretion system component Hcp